MCDKKKSTRKVNVIVQIENLFVRDITMQQKHN